MITNPAISSPYGASAIGRPVDPSYPSNRLAVLGAAITGIGFAAYNYLAAESLPSSAFAAAVAVFLAWAIAREIDPDSTLAAGVAMVAAAGWALVASPSLLLAAGVLMGARLISGTVGLELTPLDRVVVVLLAALLGSGVLTIAAVPLLAIGVIINDQRGRHPYLTAGLVVAAAAIVLAVRQPEVVWAAPSLFSLMLVALVAAVGFLLRTTNVASPTDFDGGELLASRVNMSRAGAAATIIMVVALAGNVGFEQTMGTAGAALLGTAIARWSP